MKILGIRTVTKVLGDPPERNEDTCTPFERGLTVSSFVMCDGATTGFSSRKWADALASSVANATGEGVEQAVREAKKNYESQFDLSKLSFFKQEAFKRGSMSTLLIARQDAERPSIIHLTAVGDSCCFLVRSGRVEKSFPLSNASEFSTSAYLLETSDEKLEWAFREETKELYWKRADWDVSAFRGCHLVFATDAVSQWIAGMREKGNFNEVGALVKNVIRSGEKFQHKFEGFVANARQHQGMAVDDSTVAVIGV